MRADGDDDRLGDELMKRVVLRTAQLYAGSLRAGGWSRVLDLTLALAMTALGPLVAGLGPRRVECPCCGWRGARFLPFLAITGPAFHVRCPRCDSKERHRGHRILYEQVLHFHERRGRLLYFAPECNITYFRANPALEVRTSEYPDGVADYHVDMTTMPFADGSWDYVVAHRVIEHLPDDRLGMREIYRTLVPGGLAILSVPTRGDVERTVEYGKPNPDEHDHYYDYGRDFVERIPAEFNVTMLEFSAYITPEQFARYGLVDDKVFVCRKPASTEVGA